MPSVQLRPPGEDTEGNDVEYLYDTYGNGLQMLVNESVGVWVYNEVGKLIEVLSATGETLYTLTYDEDRCRPR